MITHSETLGRNVLGLIFKPVKFLLYFVAGVLGILVLLSVTGTAIPLNFLKDNIENLAFDITGRQLKIEGDIGVVPGLAPSARISRIQLPNPDPWTDTSFVSVESLSASIHIIPLLSGEIHIGVVNLDTGTVNGIKDKNGNASWEFDLPQSDESDPEKPHDESSSGNSFSLIAIDGVHLSQLEVNFRDDSTGRKSSFVGESITLTAPENQPVQLDIQGTVGDLPLILSASSSSLAEIMALSKPLDVSLIAELSGQNLNIDGHFDGKTDLALQADLQGHSPERVAELFGIALPGVEEYLVTTSLTFSEGRISLPDVQIQIDESRINGNLELDTSGEIIEIAGALDIEHFLLDPFVSASNEDAVDSSETIVGGQQETVAQDKSTPDSDSGDSSPEADDFSTGLADLLSRFEVDLNLDIGNVQMYGAKIHDSSVHVLLQEGLLETPLSINLNAIPISGSLTLDTSADIVAVIADLQAENEDIGDLEEWVRLEGIEGSLGVFSLYMESAGKSPKDLVAAIKARLKIKDANLYYGNDDTSSPVAFSIQSLEAKVARDEPVSLNANGTLLQEDFTIRFEAGKLGKLFRGKEWPLSLSAKGAGAELSIEGIISQSTREAPSELEFKLHGSRISDLESWIGVSPDSNSEYLISATAKSSGADWNVENLMAKIGSSEFTGNISSTRLEDGPLYQFALNSTLIDVPELTAIFTTEEILLESVTPVSEKSSEIPADESNQSESVTAGTRAIKGMKPFLSIPILPNGISLPSSDVEISLDVLRLNNNSLTDIGFTGEIREGILNPAPFSMSISSEVLTGDIAFNAVSDPPTATLNLHTRNIDIGGLLSELGYSDTLDIFAEQLSLVMNLKGQKLGGILRNSEILGKVENGLWSITHPGSGDKLDLVLESADLTVQPDQPISLVQHAVLNGEQIEITILLERPYGTDNTSGLNLKISASLADADLTLIGKTDLPLDLTDATLDMDFKGDTFESLAKVTGFRLPDVGPYDLSGNFRMDQTGFHLENLIASVGESTLNGYANLFTNTESLKFDVSLESEKIQLNDFQDTDKKRKKTLSVDQNQSEDTNSQDDPIEEDAEQEPSPRFSAETLGLANGTISIVAHDVYSGEDRLGDGNIMISLQDSELKVQPVTLSLPGGGLEASLIISPVDKDVRAQLKVKLEEFDYGVLARRVKPDSEMSGTIHLDIELDSTTKYLHRLMANANGHVDFLLIPVEFEAGIIDLWAVSLLAAALPSLGSEPSLLNCLVARMNIEDGIMEEEELILDTSKIRAEGQGEINFRKQAIDYKLVPKAKNAGFFQVQAPLEIEGSFADLQFGLQGGIVGTALRMVATTYTVPIRMLMGKDVPEDGSDVCLIPEKRSVE